MRRRDGEGVRAMSTVEDGGPAFPAEGPSAGQFEHPGMTLRDYFAAQVAPTVLSNAIMDFEHDGYQENWRMGVAIDAYMMADALLAARERTHD